MNDSGVKIEVHLIQNFAPSNLNRDDTGQPKSAYFGGVRRARVSSQCAKRAAREWWRESGKATVGSRTKRLQQMIGDKLAQDKEFVERVPDEEDRKVGIRLFTEAYYAASDKKNTEKTSVLIFIGPDEVDVCARAIKETWDDWTKETARNGKPATETVEGIASVIKKAREYDAKNAVKKTTSDSDMEDGAGKDESEETGDEEAFEQARPSKKDERPKLKPIERIKERIKAAHVSADIALFGRMLAEQPGRNTDGACQVA
ncbi:MAG: type I-E CRISPR-associated protein Cas7/Cse4/CasC, partial [Dehalococcoidales bacterium]|nr:type I-E CRISPR-associated protein Cas7/Cse4/CasC [Dehalococcoidales bacterium]